MLKDFNVKFDFFFTEYSDNKQTLKNAIELSPLKMKRIIYFKKNEI